MHRRQCLKGAMALLLLGLAPPGLARGDALGRVRDLREEVWLSESQLLDRLHSARAVIVGERHDNPEHHRLERWLINRLAQASQLGGVAMEMLDSSQQPGLDAHSANQLLELSDDELRKAVKWNSGWEWQAYGPTLRLALERGQIPQAANLDREAIQAIVADNQPPRLPSAVADAQQRALVEGHCGMLPEHRLDGMLAAQIARDRAMAETLERLPATALLICGSGHARRDIGVALHSDIDSLALGLVELEPEQHWRDALPTSVDAEPPFDLAWFTSSVERGDPCAGLREHFADGVR